MIFRWQSTGSLPLSLCNCPAPCAGIGRRVGSLPPAAGARCLGGWAVTVHYWRIFHGVSRDQQILNKNTHNSKFS